MSAATLAGKRVMVIGLLLADESTSNLDPKTANHVFEVLNAIVRATGLATLIATQSMGLAARHFV